MSGSVVSELVLKFTGDTSSAMAAVGALDSKVATSAKNYVESMGKMDNSLAKLVAAHPAAATGVAAAAAAFVYVAAKSIEAAESYDKQTVGLQNTAQISSAAANQISTSFLKTAGDSTFSADKIMGAYAPVSGMLGQVEGHALTNSDAMKVMSASQELAEATGADLGKTTNNVAQVMKDYHLNTNQAGVASNDLYNLQRLTGNSTDSLVTAFNRLQPVIAGSNISVDQSSGLMLEMTTAFGSGRKAIGLVGTTLQAMTEPTSSAQKALAGVGIKLTDTNGKFIGLGPALDAFKGYMDGGASSTEKNALMQSVFGKNADDMKKIVEGGSAALDKNTKSVTGNNEVGKAAAANANTLEGKQKTLSASFKDVEIIIGKALLPAVTALMTGIMKIIDPIMKWITKHEELVGIIAKVIGIMLVLAGVLVVVGAAIDLILSPWTAVIAIIALVIVFHTKILNFLKQWWPLILGVMTGGVGMLIGVFIKWHEQIWQMVQKVWDDILGFLKAVWAAIKLAATTAFDAIRDAIQAVWDFIKNAATTVWSGISTAIQAVWTALKLAATTAFNAIRDAIQAVWDFVKNAAITTWTAISTAVQAVWTALRLAATTVFTAIQNAIQAVWDFIKSSAIAAWSLISAAIQAVWNAIKIAATTVFTAIQNAIQLVWDTIKTAATTMWNAISLVVQAVWNALKLAATTIFTAIQNAIQAVWNTISTAASVMWNAISNNVIQPVWNALKTAASAVFTGIQNVIQGVWDNIKSAAKTMWDAIVSAVKVAWDAIKAVVRDPINVVIDVVNAFTGGAAKVLDIVGVHVLDSAKIAHVGFASGGQVPGGWGGGDTVPAMLTPGERVLSTHQVKQMGGHSSIDNMLGMAHGGTVPGVQYFADGGVVVSGGMSNGAFHGAWKDNVDGVTYQDTNPSGGHFISAAQLTALVNGTDSVKNQGGSLVGGLVSAAGAVGGAVASAASTVASVPGLVASALVGLGKDFVFGALTAAATLALAPLKAAVGVLPDKPLGAGLAKGGANKILDGIYNFIAHKDKELGHAPVAVGGNGMTGSVSVAQEAAALAYAVSHFMGLPYTWGNNDCSGIVQKSYAAQGVSLPRVSSTQYGASVAVSEATAVPGDLAFYNPGTSGAPAGLPGHVGFYAGNGKIFDAYNTSRPIGYDPLSLPGNTFMGIRRPGGIAGGAGTAPGGNVATWINAALAAEGWPTSWASSINTILMRESGGNPNAINLTDSNAKAGHPSQGLMQTIPSTFNAYRDPKLSSSITDPVANIVAAVRYILARYGSVAAVASRPGGYEVGAWDTGYRAHMAMIHPNEMIIPAGPASAIRSGANVFGGDGEYVSNRGPGTGHGIDYGKLAAAMKAHSSVHVDNINVTQSDASPSDIMDEFNWNMRTARLAVQ